MISETLDMQDIGKYLQGLISKQMSVTEKAARYLGVTPRYPTLTGYDPSLLDTQIMGYEAEMESIIGPNIVIAYNPAVALNPKMREKVPAHEGVHLAQLGKNKVSKIRALTPFGYFHLGHSLIDGGAEVILERIGEGRTGAYEREYRFAEYFDREIMDLGDLYKMAEYRGTDALIDFLNKPEVNKKLYRALLENYVNDVKN